MNIFEEKETGLSINLDNITKEYIDKLSSSVAHSVMEGNDYAIHQYIKAKGVAEIASSIMDKIKDLAVFDAENYSDGEKIYGCGFQIKSSPNTYDFSHDDQWKMINQKIESLKVILKDREKEMINAIGYSQLVDSAGEVIPPAKIKKQGSKTIAISIPK
jgi:hypothetical protein